MDKIDYSVVIRTLGLAGEKYLKMLHSIDCQTIKPREVLVVLADGYDLPPERLGYERFIYSKKGIVSQRALGAKEAAGEFCLFLDDDMLFDATMVEELAKPLSNGLADVSFPILLNMLPHGKSEVMSLIAGHTFPMIRNRKNNYVRILRNGGWSYNNTVDESKICYYYSQSAPGGIYLARREAAIKIRFEEEDWLQKASFSFPDDQINFYKFHVLGYKIVGVSGLHIEHLDGGSQNPGRQLKAAYAAAKHIPIFWHRFILKNDSNFFSRLLSVLFFAYGQFFGMLHSIFCILKKNGWKCFVERLKGVRDAIKFICSEEYKKLPVVKKENYL